MLTLWQNSFKNTSTAKNHTRTPSKSDYSTSNTLMKDLTIRINSAIDIVELGVILELRYVPVYYIISYDLKGRSCERFLKSKLTEKYENPLLFLTVEQNRLIIIISLTY